MIKLYTVKTSRGLKKYLEDGERDGTGLREYYMGDAHKPGEAWGKGAAKLAEDFGIDLGSLSDDQWQNLFDGKAPNGERLVQTQNGKHRPGYDVVFAPPKDFSIEMLYASPEQRARNEKHHLDAMKIAMSIFEDHAQPCRPANGKGGTGKERADLVTFFFTHYTSRPTAESIAAKRPADLGLHTHAMVMNLAWSAGKWRAVNERRLMHKIRWARYVYESELTDRLEQDGYKIDYMDEDRRGNRTWNLAGGSQELRDLFSSRSKGIKSKLRDFEKRYGRPPTWEEQQDVVRNGRKAKDHEECTSPTWDDYKDAVKEEGIEFDGHERQSPDGRLTSRSLTERKERARKRLHENLLRNGSTFQRFDLEPAVWASSLGLLTPEETWTFLDEILSSDEIVVVATPYEDHDYDRLTTAENLKQERYCVTAAIDLSRQVTKAPDKAAIWLAITEYELLNGIRLDDEQRAAVKTLCSSTRWAHLTGPAGCGKTSVGRPVIASWKSLNRTGQRYAPKVYGVAVAASTAQRLAAGFKCDQAYTVDALALVAEKIPEGSLVVLDEAVMADTSRMAKFVKVAEERKLTVRCFGDFYQLEAVGAGGTFREINDAIGCSELTKVYRQKNWRDRAALSALRNGHSKHALSMFNRMGRFHEADSFEESMGDLLLHYKDARAKGMKPNDIIINTDAPNEHIDRLNRLVQDLRRGYGELRGESFVARSELDDRDEAFGRGDRICFTAPYEDEEHRKRVPNGTRGEVTRVTPWGVVVRTDEGETLNVLLSAQADTQPLRLAYAGHATRTQGAQSKLCLVLPWLSTTDRGSAYSMASRGIVEVHIFNGHDREKLAAKWERFSPKKTANDDLLGEWSAEFDVEPEMAGTTADEMKRWNWEQARTKRRVAEYQIERML